MNLHLGHCGGADDDTILGVVVEGVFVVVLSVVIVVDLGVVVGVGVVVSSVVVVDAVVVVAEDVSHILKLYHLQFAYNTYCVLSHKRRVERSPYRQ